MVRFSEIQGGAGGRFPVCMLDFSTLFFVTLPRYIMPLPVDSSVGMGLIKMLDIADSIYNEFLNLLSIFILVSFRVQVGGQTRRSVSESR